uniref:S-layer homology domain-containing protein n=1 Tax=Paenibacillus campi TaxID=3106031 RepID=UPI002AFFF7B5
QTVRVYSDANVQLAEETANANGTAVLTFTFPGASGELSVRTVANGTETEIGTLPYSGIVIPAPTPTADLTDINGAQGTVTVTNVAVGQTVRVYSDANVQLAEATANANGTAVLSFAFPSANGELSVRTVSNGVETEVAAIPYSGIVIPTTPTPVASLSSVNGDEGVVTVTGVTAGQTVRVYSDANVQLAEETANANGTAVLTFTFPGASGELSVRTVANGTETEIGTLPYSGVVIPAPTPTADLTDINGAQGTVTVSNAQPGDVIKVYGANNELLGTQSVGSNGEATVNFTFTTADGDLTVTYTRGGTETNIVTLPYSGVDIPTTPQPGAIISDIDGAQGTVTVTDVAAGQTVRVYSDANVQLAEETANANGTAVLTFTFPGASGELSVRTVANGTETEIGTLPYSGIVIPAPTPTADLTDITGAQGTVTVSNAQPGDVIKVYGANNELLGTQSVGSNGEATVVFTFTTADGDLTVTYTRGGTETNIVTLPYSGVDIPTTPQPGAIISDIDGAQGTVTVTDVAAGQTVRVYSDANVQLAEETANANGTAVLTFTFPGANGELSVRTVANGTETEIGTLPYSGVVIPPNDPPAAELTDVNGTQGTVTVTNVAAGQTVRVYSDANVQLAEETANANGTAVLSFAFPSASGELSVRTVANGTETEIDTLPYSGVVIPTPTPTADLTDINGAQGTVTVSNAQPGDVINVYGSNNELLGTQTANANGEAVVTFTFTTADGDLTVTYTRGGTETNIDTLPYSGVDIPTTPQPTPEAVLDSVNGSQGSVTVSNVAANEVVRVYDANNTLLAEGTANGNGTLQLTFTFQTASGTLSVRTVSNGTETEIDTLPYSGANVPTTPGDPENPQASLITTQGSQGTVRVNGVLTGDTVTVQSNVYGQGTIQLGNVTVNTDGFVDVSIQFPETSGQVVVILNRNGTSSTVATIDYNTQNNVETSGDNDLPAGSIPGQLGWPYPVGDDTTGTGGGAAGTGTPQPAGETGTTPPTTEPTDNNVGAAAGEGTAAGENANGIISLTSGNVADFDDTIGHWAQSEITRLHRLGILNGVGGNRYNPNATLTRAQFAQMINNMLQLRSDGTKANYSDIRSSAWYNKAIQAVTTAGISNGYTDGTYKPNRNISREEMAHILLNTMRYLDPNDSFGTDTNQTLSRFSDQSKVGNWARPDLASAIAEQLIKGKPGNKLDPKANTTRAEAAVTLSRLIDQMNESFKID